MMQYRSIYKWLTFGTILLLISITIIPSISHNIATASNINKSKDITYWNIGDFLFIILKKIFGMRVSLFTILTDYSMRIEYHGDPPQIIHPIVFLLAFTYGLRIVAGINFWSIIASLSNFQWTGDELW